MRKIFPTGRNRLYHARQPISIHQSMDKETEAAPTASTPQDTKPATASSDKKSFGRDVGKLVSGTVVAQAVALCLTPVITRIFSPEIYGVASVFTSIVLILVVIACMRYELAILLPKDDKDAGAVFHLCLIILVCISLLCIPIILLFGDLIADLLGSDAVKDYLFLVPVAVFIDGLYLALRYWNTRRKRFGTQAATQAMQSISGNGLKLGFGTLGLINPGSLILGDILGKGAGTLILLLQAMRADLKLILQSFSLKNIRKQMIRFKKFPLIDTWSSFINTLSWQMPVLLLTGFFSPAIAGFYTLGFQMTQAPLSLIGSSISQVFFQRLSVAKHDGTMGEITTDICSLMFLITVFPCILLMVVGGDLFSLVFGSEWREAGVFAQILAIWIMIWFVSSVLSPVISILEIQGLGFMTSSANLLTRAVSLVIGGIVGSVYLGLWLFSLTGILVSAYCIFAFMRKTGGSFVRVWKNIWIEILFGVGAFVVLVLLEALGVSGFVTCGIAVLIGICYVVWLVRKNRLVQSYLFR